VQKQRHTPETETPETETRGRDGNGSTMRLLKKILNDNTT
jgi:hypothetical protein